MSEGRRRCTASRPTSSRSAREARRRSATGRRGSGRQVVPYLYYPDANEALEFLVRAFGFEEHAVTRDADGAVWNAQLRTGSGLVMIGPGIDEFGTRPVPDPAWATSRVHVLVDDLDAHHARAAAAGAVIHSDVGVHLGQVRIYVAGDCGGQQWIVAEPVEA